MKLELEINNLAKAPVKNSWVRQVVTAALERSGRTELAGKSVSLSLAWVSEEEIARLNKAYRRKDRPTDVLSFCEFETASELAEAAGPALFLGELILCYNFIKESASECTSESELREELARIIAHGVLHLLGFAHGRKMFSLQDMVAEGFSPDRTAKASKK